MGTYLSGVFNVGLKGERDRAVYNRWLEELNKIEIPRALALNDKNEWVPDTGEWEFVISGFGGDDPSEALEEDMAYTVTFQGPFMFYLELRDSVSSIETFFKLYVILEENDWFESYVKHIHDVIRVFHGTEIIWLSCDGPTQYASIFQSEVWSDTPYDQVKQLCIDRFGDFITSYSEMTAHCLEHNTFYDDLDKVMLDVIPSSDAE